MATWTDQTYSTGEILYAAQLNQLYSNVDLVRQWVADTNSYTPTSEGHTHDGTDSRVLADGAITSSQIGSGQIGRFHIGDNAITSNHISSLSVGGEKLSKTVTGSYTQVVDRSTTWTISEGFYNIGFEGINVPANVNLLQGTRYVGKGGGTILADGVNMKLQNTITDSDITVYLLKY
jgi:hypothetical protein